MKEVMRYQDGTEWRPGLLVHPDSHSDCCFTPLSSCIFSCFRLFTFLGFLSQPCSPGFFFKHALLILLTLLFASVLFTIQVLPSSVLSLPWFFNFLFLLQHPYILKSVSTSEFFPLPLSSHLLINFIYEMGSHIAQAGLELVQLKTLGSPASAPPPIAAANTQMAELASCYVVNFCVVILFCFAF